MILKQVIFSVLFCVLATPTASQYQQNGTFLQYETDYTPTEIIRLASQGAVSTVSTGGGYTGPIENVVSFWCINRKTNQVIQTRVNDPDINSKIDFTKPLVTVTHGWLDNVNRTWVQNTLRDLITYYDVNACGVDWSYLADFEIYLCAINHVPKVGDYQAVFIQYLSNLGINLKDVTMVGHSYGGQVVGQAGMRLNGKVGAIFGLDIGGAPFCTPLSNYPINKRLDPTDAQFVQVIHTTDGTIDCPLDCGHQDFRPDGGIVPQKACMVPFASQTLFPDIVLCSHLQAVEYFRYSLNPNNVFTGNQCSSYMAYNFGLCALNPTDVIGPRTQRRPGNYYLYTSFYAPFTPK